MKITYLGPSGTTFSALAYVKLAELFGAPGLVDGEESLAGTNEEVLSLVIEHGGWGVVAMETMAEGRVEGPVNSFLRLLDCHQTAETCRTKIVGAIEMPINFALMAQSGVAIRDIDTVVTHIKSFGACKNKIQALGAKFVESSSNGQAALDVANKPTFAKAAALAPKTAASKYGLQILEEAFEDRLAVTTFFLLGPKINPPVSLGKVYRSMLVSRFKNRPGSLVEVLIPFATARINLRHVRDYYTGGGQYDFVCQFDCHGDQVVDHARAMGEASKHMERHILFGPFPVV